MTGSFPAPQPFQAQVVASGGRYRLILSGELDLSAAPELEAVLARLSGNGTTAVLVDLRKLTFIDSRGLRAILRAQELADSRGYQLSLLPGPPAVQNTFEVSGLLEALPFASGAGQAASDEPGTADGPGS